VLTENTLNPAFIEKPTSSEYYLGSEFLVMLYDGSGICSETKDAFKSGMTANIDNHGVSGSFFIQPGFLFNAMIINRDEDGILARLLISHAESMPFDATNEDMVKGKEEHSTLIDSSYTGNIFKGLFIYP
jgi:hypothetical protein